MGSSNSQMARQVTSCPECDSGVDVTLVATDKPITCGECGCRFWFGLVPFGFGDHGPNVEAHGDRWRRFRLVPHAQLNWEVGGIGVGWEKPDQGLELYLALGPLILSLYGGPGLAR